MNRKDFEGLGFYPANILLPQENLNMEKWAVVACDQFTAQPEYWEAVEALVDQAPSTLRLMLPEAKLASGNVEQDITAINTSMEAYLDRGLLRELSDSLVYVERTQSDGKVRHGLVGMVDLESYDFTPGSQSLIRASEGTILSRIPPRVKVRKDAPIELPHIMILIDDPLETVIKPLSRPEAQAEKLYDFELMQGGGHIRGFRVSEKAGSRLAASLRLLADSQRQSARYSMTVEHPLLFVMGDGNHSLATAKQCYEDQKKTVPQEQWPLLPSRYALAEIVNLHDEALQFEAIHRVVFGQEPQELLQAFFDAHPEAYFGEGSGQSFTVCFGGEKRIITVPHPKKQLAVATLQDFLDSYASSHTITIDYIHGDDVVRSLARQPQTTGFLLPAMGKDEVFRTVMADGVLPRKTFSMGHARDKRYYLEARKIR